MCVVSAKSLSIKESNGLGEETLTSSGHEGPNAAVPSARWHDGGSAGAV